MCDSCSHIPTLTASSFHENIGMFTAAFTLMDEGQWEACTSTTNPVESINRESVPKDGRQKSLSEVLTRLYRIDKIYTAKKLLLRTMFPLLTETSHPPAKRKGGRGRGIGGVEVKLQWQMMILRVCIS